MASRRSIFAFCLLAMGTEQAVLKTVDLNQQIRYPCPAEAQMTCAVTFRLNSVANVLGPTETLLRLDCREDAVVESKCSLPEIFAFNQTKLMRVRDDGPSEMHLDDFDIAGDFADLGCANIQTSICKPFHGQGYRTKSVHYVLALRCIDVMQKNCSGAPLRIGERVTALLPVEEIDVDGMLAAQMS